VKQKAKECKGNWEVSFRCSSSSRNCSSDKNAAAAEKYDWTNMRVIQYHTIPAGDCRSAAAALHITRRLTPTACSYDIYNIVTDGKNLLHYAVMTSY